MILRVEASDYQEVEAVAIGSFYPFLPNFLYILHPKAGYSLDDLNFKLHTGFDVRANLHTPIVIKPNEIIKIPAGVKAASPMFTYTSLVPRSGLSYKTKLRIPNSPATIEHSYRNEIAVLLENTGNTEETIEPTMRLAQLLPKATPFFRGEANLVFFLYEPEGITEENERYADLMIMTNIIIYLIPNEDYFMKLWERWPKIFESERGEQGFGSTGLF